MRVGDVEVLVEARAVPGSEPTSGRVGAAVDRVAEGFDRAEETITAIACRVAGTVGELTRRAARPDRMEVEFGLSFTATGNVIVVGGAVEATLKVTVAYDGHHHGGTTRDPGPRVPGATGGQVPEVPGAAGSAG